MSRRNENGEVRVEALLRHAPERSLTRVAELEMLAEPLDAGGPENSSTYRALERVRTLPRIRALRRERIEAAGDPERGRETVKRPRARLAIRIASWLTFWR